MKKSAAIAWVKALRSGHYKPGKSYLRNSADEHCCLGVACRVAKIKSKLSDTWRYDDCITSAPLALIKKWDLFHSFGSRRDHQPVVIAGNFFDSLAGANDDGCSQSQIADYIEQNWKAL